MPRINLDTPFFGDPRIIYLGELTTEGRLAARGRIIGLWHFCYLKTQEILTAIEVNQYSEWFNKDNKCFADLLVKVGLAEKVESGFRIKGVKERYQYLVQARENGRIGGIQSGRIRNSKQKRSDPQAPLEQTLGDATDSLKPPSSEKNPLVLVPSPALDKNNTCSTGIERMDFDFESLYEKYPRHRGKKQGLARCKKNIRTQEQFNALSNAIDYYTRSCCGKETRYIQYFSTFINNWEDWANGDPDKQKNEEDLESQFIPVSHV